MTLADGRAVRSEIVLYAAGRTGNVGSLGLDAVGIEADSRGRIKVDPQTFQTSVPNIYAAGDVIGFPSLASTSMEQGRVAACHAFGVPLPPRAGDVSLRHLRGAGDLDRRPVGGGGARRAASPYEVGIARFRETSRGHIMGVEFGLPEADLRARHRAACSAPTSSARARPS